VRELQARLEVERADREEIEAQLTDREKQIEELRSELSDRDAELGELRSELKQKSAAASKDLPEAAEVYNQFKANNPKTKTTYKEVVDILARVQAMIEG
jgi:chromosome segregation ATPase